MMSEERLGMPEDAPRGRGRPPKEVSERLAADRERVERDHAEREVLEDRELSDDERLELFMDGLQQSVLPDLPRMPGYHLCWLTTQNPRDSIQRRLMIGYELIKLEMVPGWSGISLRAGDYEGCIGINEMVAARIPLRLYNKYMNKVHHERPLSDEEQLQARTDLIKDDISRRGGRVAEMGDGTAEIVSRARPMVFTS